MSQLGPLVHGSVGRLVDRIACPVGLVLSYDWDDWGHPECNEGSVFSGIN